jgi:hypothetical protein
MIRASLAGPLKAVSKAKLVNTRRYRTSKQRTIHPKGCQWKESTEINRDGSVRETNRQMVVKNLTNEFQKNNITSININPNPKLRSNCRGVRETAPVWQEEGLMAAMSGTADADRGEA